MKRFFAACMLMLISVSAFAESLVPPELLDKVVAYTQKVYDAALPVAKKAWEIGMLTLQIDALATIIPTLFTLILTAVAIRILSKKFKANDEQAKKVSFCYMGEWQFANALMWLSGSVVVVWCISVLLNIWLWVKLFQPELWLAHEAIEKLVK